MKRPAAEKRQFLQAVAGGFVDGIALRDAVEFDSIHLPYSLAATPRLLTPIVTGSAGWYPARDTMSYRILALDGGGTWALIQLRP